MPPARGEAYGNTKSAADTVGLITASPSSTMRFTPLSLACTCSSIREGTHTPETCFQSTQTTVRYFLPFAEVSSNFSKRPVARSSHISRLGLAVAVDSTSAAPSSLTAAGFSGMNLSGL